MVLDDHLPRAPAADALVLLAEIAGMAWFEVHRLTEQVDQFPVEPLWAWHARLPLVLPG